jgi:DNA-binding beta-propeller fold protein YncE
MSLALAALIALAACQRSISFPPGSTFPPPKVLPSASKPRLVITNSGEDTFAFVSLDLPQPRLLARVPVGDDPIDIEAPHDVAISPSGDTIYVVLANPGPGAAAGPHGGHGASSLPGVLLALDARTAEKRAETLLDPNAGEILLDASGATAYVSHYDVIKLAQQVQSGLPEASGWSRVAFVDTTTMTPTFLPVCATTHDLELSADGNTLYVTCSETDEIALVDVRTRAVQRLAVADAPGQPLAPAYSPYAAVRAPADDSLWISCDTSDELRVYDAHAGRMDPMRTVALHGVPQFGDFLDDGSTLVMPQRSPDRLSFIDTAHAREVAVVPLPSAACLNARNALVVSGVVYVVCEGDHQSLPGSLVAVDVSSHALLGTLELGLFPTAIALAPAAP